jgi:hypothetical protein
MKILSKYILPAALVAGFLFYFFSDAFARHFSLDDCFYEGLVRKYGTAGSVKVIYDIANGRWFSHIICALSFRLIGTGFTVYGLYLTFLLLLFVFSLSILYGNYCSMFLKRNASFFEKTSFSLVFTATLYFLLFEGRWETWGWISSANTHLLSVVISFMLFSFLIYENARTSSVIWVFILGAFSGGLNEVNAICSALIIGGLFLLNKFYFPQIKLNKINMLVSIVTIAISLLVNICSGGYKLRMEGLPDFSFIQSVENTAHSFLFPVLHYKFALYFFGALLIFILFIKDGVFRFSKKSLVISVFALVIVAVSFFLHCYTLSDTVPARGAIWGYCLLLFGFSTFFIPAEKS